MRKMALDLRVGDFVIFETQMYLRGFGQVKEGAEAEVLEVSSNKILLDLGAQDPYGDPEDSQFYFTAADYAKGVFRKEASKRDLDLLVRKYGKEFSSPEALKEYLKQHPKADHKKHWVKDKKKKEENILEEEYDGENMLEEEYDGENMLEEEYDGENMLEDSDYLEPPEKEEPKKKDEGKAEEKKKKKDYDESSRHKKLLKKKPKKEALLQGLVKLASEVPEIRKELVPLIHKYGMEFSSPEALKEYLSQHPKADRKKHWVKQRKKHQVKQKGEDKKNKNPRELYKEKKKELDDRMAWIERAQRNPASQTRSGEFFYDAATKVYKDRAGVLKKLERDAEKWEAEKESTKKKKEYDKKKKEYDKKPWHKKLMTKKPKKEALLQGLVKLASEVPEIRKELVPLVRKYGMEFSSPEALEKYLKKHPKADRKKHQVKDKKRKPKEEEIYTIGIPATGKQKAENDLRKLKREEETVKDRVSEAKREIQRAKKEMERAQGEAKKEQNAWKPSQDHLNLLRGAFEQGEKKLEKYEKRKSDLEAKLRKFPNKFRTLEEKLKKSEEKKKGPKSQKEDDFLEPIGKKAPKKKAPKKKAAEEELFRGLQGLAGEVPEIRKELVPLIRKHAAEFTEQEWDSYSKQHPGADRRNHTIRKVNVGEGEDDGGGEEKEEKGEEKKKEKKKEKSVKVEDKKSPEKTPLPKTMKENILAPLEKLPAEGKKIDDFLDFLEDMDDEDLWENAVEYAMSELDDVQDNIGTWGGVEGLHRDMKNTLRELSDQLEYKIKKNPKHKKELSEGVEVIKGALKEVTKLADGIRHFMFDTPLLEVLDDNWNTEDKKASDAFYSKMGEASETFEQISRDLGEARPFETALKSSKKLFKEFSDAMQILDDAGVLTSDMKLTSEYEDFIWKNSSDKSLLRGLVKLASEVPETRKELLPLLRKYEAD